MRTQTLGRGAIAPTRKSLVVRGGPARTFGSLVSSLAVIFLCFGLYLLEDALAHPLEAQAVEVITGAFTIALAATLIYYLLKPRKRLRTRTRAFRREG
jgi:lipopolysaccharide export LptBFGC system permease protein LptF